MVFQIWGCLFLVSKGNSQLGLVWSLQRLSSEFLELLAERDCFLEDWCAKDSCGSKHGSWNGSPSAELACGPFFQEIGWTGQLAVERTTYCSSCAKLSGYVCQPLVKRVESCNPLFASICGRLRSQVGLFFLLCLASNCFVSVRLGRRNNQEKTCDGAVLKGELVHKSKQT